MIEAFRQRGIRPTAVGSLAVQSLLLEAEDLSTQASDAILAEIVSKLLDYGARQLGRNLPITRSTSEHKRRTPRKLTTPTEWVMQQSPYSTEPADEVQEEVTYVPTADEEREPVLREVASALGTWAKNNKPRLKVDPGLPVAVRGFHPVHRIASTGELLVEMVAHFIQTDKTPEDLGGLKYRAGVTMIANIDGQIRYVITKPFQEARKGGLRDWVTAFDESNGNGWPASTPDANRMKAAFSARAMDARRWR